MGNKFNLWKGLIILIIFIGLGISNTFGPVDNQPIPQEQPVDETTKSNLLSVFGKVPLHFVANQGQFPEEVVYYAKNEGATVYCTDIPTFKEVVYREVYPGIDLIYSGDQRRLKYTFYLQPHSDPNQIQMIYGGIESLCVDDATGELVIQTGWGEIRDAAPVAYQEIKGAKKKVDISFRLPVRCTQTGLIGEKRVGFALGDYDPNFMLTLDPGYSTYLGGSDGDWAFGIAVDSSGNAYVTGKTLSSDFPTQNPYQGSFGGGYAGDVFVTKLSSSGNTLIYSTYLGGSRNDSGLGIAVDSEGNAYVAGYTDSSNFPTQNPYQDSNAGREDAFVTKLSSNGDTLIYSTYLGGWSSDYGTDIAVDSEGNAYMTGRTPGGSFPTKNAYQGTCGAGGGDVFVTKLSNSGNTLIYSTYLGGNNNDYSTGIAVDSEGNAYVTGYTNLNFPTQNAYQDSNAGAMTPLWRSYQAVAIRSFTPPTWAGVIIMINAMALQLTVGGMRMSRE